MKCKLEERKSKIKIHSIRKKKKRKTFSENDYKQTCQQVGTTPHTKMNQIKFN